MKKIILIFFLFPLLSLSAGSVMLEWKEVPFSGGYLIEIQDKQGNILAEIEISDTTYLFEGEPGKYRFRLNVINRLGDIDLSSEWIDFKIKKPEREDPLFSAYASVSANLIIPSLTTVEEYFSYGLGVACEVGFRDFFLSNLNLGLQYDFLYVKGESEKSLDNAQFHLLAMDISYDISLGKKITLSPGLMGGVAFVNLQPLSDLDIDLSSVEGWRINPLCGAGLKLQYNFETFKIFTAMDLFYIGDSEAWGSIITKNSIGISYEF